jgi:ATP-dependent exoDNAse (exonuclease V) beta subunit
MSPVRNRAIAASAGTGKTFRLAHRYLGLLAAGVEPDRICALTFSRKAAGEIFDKIVDRLCRAAQDGRERATTAAIIKKEGLPAPPDRPEAYVAHLRNLLDHGHRLRIGTLDSFILGVVRAFPMELGISPDTQPMDGDGGEAEALRRAILARIFDPARRPAVPADEADGFLDDFRLACFGQEGKSLEHVLARLIEAHYGFYRRHGHDAWHWGDAARIWPDDQRWWDEARLPEAGIPADLPDQLASASGAGKCGQICGDIAKAALAHAVDRPWPKLNDTIFPTLISSVTCATPPTLTYNRKDYPIPPDLWPGLRAALARLIRIEVGRSTKQSHGLGAILARYGLLYDESLRTGGRLTFEDLSRLLGEDGLSPSRQPERIDDRLYIDYRLDARLDHWLLDEFQDTSDTQWAALANLIDEVVQREDRSFFYVGDVKQSIYGWRGGNHRLFNEIQDQYADLGPRAIAAESIAACHRSLPAIIRTVNAVFDGLAQWHQGLAGEEAKQGPRTGAVAAFAQAWQRHESARQDEGEGFAALREYTPKGKSGHNSDADGNEDAVDSGDPGGYTAVADILREAQPTRRGLTAAVLVRSNQEGRACVDALRQSLPDVPVVHEGRGGIVDCPVVNLLLALVRQAAHPGDTTARCHLQMSPLALHPDMPPLDALPGLLLAAIHQDGFAETLRTWGRRLGDLDPFGRQRLRELLAAAAQFDATGVRDGDAFIDHVHAYQVKAGAAAGTVRVMTIHQAKGLGFDLVIVPFSPNAKSFGSPGDAQLLAGDDWVLATPRKQVLEAVGGRPVEVREDGRTDANFSQLCVLYVALTRAQRALYLVVPKAANRPTVMREADLLRQRLVKAPSDTPSTPEPLAAPVDGSTEQFADGDRQWYDHLPPRTTAADAAAETVAPIRMAYAQDVARREPSKDQAEGRSFPATWLFRPEAGDVLAFGSAIHRLFEQVEWIEDADLDRILAAWRAASADPPALLVEVEQQFRACVANPEVRRILARPAGAPRADAWREAPFNLVLTDNDGPHLVGGRFDRLVVERDPDGLVLRATILDFKSNRVETEADVAEAAQGYAGQMADYARAAARLLALPPTQVATALLFTRVARLWRGS